SQAGQGPSDLGAPMRRRCTTFTLGSSLTSGGARRPLQSNSANTSPKVRASFLLILWPTLSVISIHSLHSSCDSWHIADSVTTLMEYSHRDKTLLGLQMVTNARSCFATISLLDWKVAENTDKQIIFGIPEEWKSFEQRNPLFFQRFSNLRAAL